jgi:hypothetical protein
MSNTDAFRKLELPASTRKSQQHKRSGQPAVNHDTRRRRIRELVDDFVEKLMAL